jgi:hypothetical protein
MTSGFAWATVTLTALYLLLAIADAILTRSWAALGFAIPICLAIEAGAWLAIRYARLPRRAGRWAQEQAAETRLRFLRTNARLFVALLLSYFALAAIVLWVPLEVSRSFRAGSALIGLLWFITWFLGQDETRPQRMGALAEQWSSQGLVKLKKVGWTVIDRVPFEAEDVDHVAISAGGVVAVETKFGSSRNFAGRALERHLDQAERGARKIRRFLKSKDIIVRVRPALVLWGPGREGLPRVAVVRGIPRARSKGHIRLA